MGIPGRKAYEKDTHGTGTRVKLWHPAHPGQ
jgi:hypothetical protein